MKNIISIKTKASNAFPTHKTYSNQSKNQLPIPREAIDINGNRVNTTGQVWQLHEQTTNLQLNWGLLSGNEETINSLKAYLFHIVESNAPQYAPSIFSCIKPAIDSIGNKHPSKIDFLDLYKIFEKLTEEDSSWRFGHVRRWYRWCFRQEISGFSKEVLNELEELKIPTFQSGLAVLTRDPEKGPFCEEEYQIIRNAVKQKRGSLKIRTIIMLLMELGLRPGQISLLDKKDVSFYKTKSGDKLFSVNLIRLKQRVSGKQEKKKRRISKELGENLLEVIRKNRIHHNHWNIAPEEPIFVSQTKNDSSNIRSLKGTKKNEKELRIPQRITVNMIRYYATRYAKLNKLISPITGNLLLTYPYRFRYTLATRLASQGAPRSILAEILDHSSLTSVDIYIKSSSNIIAHLNEALGKNSYYMETINLFKGDISSSSETNNESVVRGSLPTLKSVGGIGVCGANYLCKLYPPLSCYLCPKFTAWKDAPHEDVLKELEAYVTGLAEKTGNASDRIPLQLKETIVAVKSLIGKIENKN